MTAVTAVTVVTAVIALISATAGVVDLVVPAGRVRYERAYCTALACVGAMSVLPRRISTLKISPPGWGFTKL